MKYSLKNDLVLLAKACLYGCLVSLFGAMQNKISTVNLSAISIWKTNTVSDSVVTDRGNTLSSAIHFVFKCLYDRLIQL